MKVFQGHSTQDDTVKAIHEACNDLLAHADSLKAVIVYYSSQYDPKLIAQYLTKNFSTAIRFGGSTAGEHITNKHFTKSLVVMGISSSEIEFDGFKIENLKNYSQSKAKDAVQELFKRQNIEPENFDASKFVAISLIDGLSLMEEQLTADVADYLEGIPIVGGSAGDDLKFQETTLLFNDEIITNSVAYILIKSEIPFEIIKHQHFEKTNQKLAITKADIASRTVFEFDGKPAIDAYAESVGLKKEEVTNEFTFLNPIIFKCDNEDYVRSIQAINDDGSLTFYCGIEEGMVVSIGKHMDMAQCLRSQSKEFGKYDLFLGFNCILRALESTNSNLHPELSSIVSEFSENMIAFDTYGEQLNGLHINQTLIGVGFGKKAA